MVQPSIDLLFDNARLRIHKHFDFHRPGHVTYSFVAPISSDYAAGLGLWMSFTSLKEIPLLWSPVYSRLKALRARKTRSPSKSSAIDEWYSVTKRSSVFE